MPRLSKKEQEESIVTRPAKTKTKNKVIRYNKIGSIEDNLTDEQSAAYMVESPNGNQYYVKHNLMNEIYEPHDTSYISQAFQLAKIRGQDGQPYRFVTVNKGQFELYVSYLKTKDKKYLSAIKVN